MSTLDKLRIQNSNFQSKKENDLPQTPRTPKGQFSPKIYSKWNILLIKNDDFYLSPLVQIMIYLKHLLHQKVKSLQKFILNGIFLFLICLYNFISLKI
jgi:hypothetical protein